MSTPIKLLLALLAALMFSASMPVESAEYTASTDYDSMARSAVETVTKFVEADTTNLPGNEARVARIAAKLLEKADIPYEITEFTPGRENIVARLKATEANPEKPLMLLAHEDVVTAANQAWTSDPHKVTLKDGYLVGRGVADDLGMASVNLEVFLYLKKTKAKLKRDVILALTGDEESGGAGILYLIKHKPESINAGIVINEGGEVVLDKDGKPKSLDFAAAEKTYQDFELVVKGITGHSSVPQKANSIYHLARALSRLEATPRPNRLIPVTRAYFKGSATLEKPPLSTAMLELANTPEKGKLPTKALQVVSADPRLAAMLHTTCVATLLNGGTRINALPSEAKAGINCRILPDESVEQIQAWLEKVVADPEVKVVNSGDEGHGPASPIDGELYKSVEKITHQLWPGLPIIPTLVLGATDSRHLRSAGIASYGLSPLPLSEIDSLREHGIDERVPLSSFRTGVEYLHKLVLEIAGS